MPDMHQPVISQPGLITAQPHPHPLSVLWTHKIIFNIYFYFFIFLLFVFILYTFAIVNIKLRSRKSSHLNILSISLCLMTFKLIVPTRESLVPV